MNMLQSTSIVLSFFDKLPYSRIALEELTQEELEDFLGEMTGSNSKIRGLVTLVPRNNSPSKRRGIAD